jgi:hypothetical protein
VSGPGAISGVLAFSCQNEFRRPGGTRGTGQVAQGGAGIDRHMADMMAWLMEGN